MDSILHNALFSHRMSGSNRDYLFIFCLRSSKRICKNIDGLIKVLI